jgi:hypothetical protein
MRSIACTAAVHGDEEDQLAVRRRWAERVVAGLEFPGGELELAAERPCFRGREREL